MAITNIPRNPSHKPSTLGVTHVVYGTIASRIHVSNQFSNMSLYPCTSHYGNYNGTDTSYKESTMPYGGPNPSYCGPFLSYHGQTTSTYYEYPSPPSLKVLHTIQGEHLVVEDFAEVFDITKLGKNFKKTSAINSRCFCGGFFHGPYESKTHQCSYRQIAPVLYFYNTHTCVCTNIMHRIVFCNTSAYVSFNAIGCIITQIPQYILFI